jgi:hypothetical protein
LAADAVRGNPLYFKLIHLSPVRARPIGRLFGDIVIEGENFTLYFPIVTSLLVSILLGLLWFINR